MTTDTPRPTKRDMGKPNRPRYEAAAAKRYADFVNRLPYLDDAKLRDLLLVAAAEYDERRRERAQAATMDDDARGN